jgi:hypothetical protein
MNDDNVRALAITVSQVIADDHKHAQLFIEAISHGVTERCDKLAERNSVLQDFGLLLASGDAATASMANNLLENPALSDFFRTQASHLLSKRNTQ